MTTVKPFAFAATIAAISVAAILTGCGSMGGPCTFDKNTGKMNCPIGSRGGKILEREVMNSLPSSFISLFAGLPANDVFSQVFSPVTPQTFDAYLVTLDTEGSTVVRSNQTGNIEVKLYKGNKLLSNRSFPWTTRGTDLVFASPASVNSWVRNNPTADGFEYNLTLTFNTTSAEMTTVKDNHYYNGSWTQSSSQTFATPRGTQTTIN